MERIRGFGSLSKKGVVHILENQANGFVTICGKKLVNPDEKLNITHVDCGNCQRLPQYNELIKEYSSKNPGTSKVVITDNGDVFDFSELKLNSPDEKKNVAELRSIFINKLHILQGAFTAEKADSDNFNIIHQLSDHVFYGNLPEKYVAPCLLMLNQIPDEWTGRGSPTKKWLESINTAFSAGYCFVENLIDLKSEDNSKIFELEKELGCIKTDLEIKAADLGQAQEKIFDLKIKLEKYKNYAIEKADFAVKKVIEIDELRKEINPPLLSEVIAKLNDMVEKHDNLVEHLAKRFEETDVSIDQLTQITRQLKKDLRETEKTSKESAKTPDNEVKTSSKKIKKVKLNF